jgi:uncharacterized membrane protein HdeD (DUF308 family)
MDNPQTKNERTATAKPGGKSMTAFGFITMILGLLALLAPAFKGVSIAMLLGVLVIAGGIVRVLWAFQAGTSGKGLLQFALCDLTLLCGIALVANPLFASGVLTILLAVFFFLGGISEMVVGLGRGPGTGGGWLLVGGIVSVLLGVMFWAQFPLSGAWAMGTLLGIRLLFVALILLVARPKIPSTPRKAN